MRIRTSTRLLLLSVLVGLYALSSHTDFMQFIVSYRFNLHNAFRSDQFAYGDLYGLSYLPEFRFRENEPFVVQPCARKDSVQVALLCDSYRMMLYQHPEELCASGPFAMGTWDGGPLEITPQPHVRRVFFVELIERNIRDRFGKNYASTQAKVHFNSPQVLAESVPSTPPTQPVLLASNGGSFPVRTGAQALTFASSRSVTPAFDWEALKTRLKALRKLAFNPNVNQNLESNLFDYRFVTGLREAKAHFNDVWFRRLPAQVARSRDGRYLYMRESTDSCQIASNFNALSEAELGQLIRNLNDFTGRLTAGGFAEVYFTFIPNTVQILEPNRLRNNRLVQRLRQHPGRQFRLIDIEPILRRYQTGASTLFRRNDSHWNQHGFHLWREQLNLVLRQEKTGS